MTGEAQGTPCYAANGPGLWPAGQCAPDVSERISFSAPLPPAELRSNSRAHWGRRMKAKVAYSEAVWLAWQTRDRRDGGPSAPPPAWEKADVFYTWRSCGVQPDKANLGQNLKALQDFLCMVPNTGLQKNDCTYLGLVQDDKHIDPRYELEPVKHRVDEGVLIEIVRRV